MFEIDASVLLTSLFALTTAVVAAKLNQVHQQNLKLREALNEKKQACYFELLNFMEDLMSEKYAGREKEVQIKIKDLVNRLVFYAPTSVIKSFGDVTQHAYLNRNDPEHGMRMLKLYAELKVQIRKDLGNVTWASGESWADILRLTITDIRDFLPPGYAKDRGAKTLPDLTFKGKRLR